MKYKVFIPSAGLGERLGSLSANINKSLITIFDKPSISYIIEKIPIDVEIVIALGYKGSILRDFLELAYPDRKITMVNIDNFQGVGSGLGYTLLKCKEHLQCPFVFCTNDTIVLEHIIEPSFNWMGYADIYDNSKYRSLEIEDHKVLNINEKNHISKAPAYIGLSGIYNYKEFWDKINSDINYGSISVGESHGLKELIKLNIKPIKFTWFDTGSINGIKLAREYFEKNTHNILPKDDESIWFINDKVIKYSHDTTFINDRIIRSKLMGSFIPQIIDKRDNMYSYKYVNGTVLSKCVNTPIFKNLLIKLFDFWEINNKDIKITCLDFYKNKTYKRLSDYFIRYQYTDKEEIINGVKIPKIMDLLNKIDWDYISKGVSSTYHGDLHFENIILSEAGDFILIDWRQNFGGIVEYGDIYYDFAKILHGIIVSHDIVSNNHFKINDNNNVINVDTYRNHSSFELENIFYEYLKDNEFDVYKVKLLTALIYLNIAALHHDPYSKFLFFFGKYMLYNLTSNPHIND